MSGQSVRSGQVRSWFRLGRSDHVRSDQVRSGETGRAYQDRSVRFGRSGSGQLKSGRSGQFGQVRSGQVGQVRFWSDQLDQLTRSVTQVRSGRSGHGKLVRSGQVNQVSLHRIDQVW